MFVRSRIAVSSPLARASVFSAEKLERRQFKKDARLLRFIVSFRFEFPFQSRSWPDHVGFLDANPDVDVLLQLPSWRWMAVAKCSWLLYCYRAVFFHLAFSERNRLFHQQNRGSEAWARIMFVEKAGSTTANVDLGLVGSIFFLSCSQHTTCLASSPWRCIQTLPVAMLKRSSQSSE